MLLMTKLSATPPEGGSSSRVRNIPGSTVDPLLRTHSRLLSFPLHFYPR